MTSRACARLGLMVLACLAVASGFAQSGVVENLFDIAPGRSRSAHKAVHLNTQAAQTLAKKPGRFTLKNFPLANGQSAGFDLEPARLFGPDTKITLVSSSGSTTSVALPDNQAWYGRDITGSSRMLVLVTKSDGTVGAMVTGDPGTSDTVVIPDAAGLEYTVAAADLPARDMCSVGELVPADSLAGTSDLIPRAARTEAESLGTGTRQVDVMLDVAYSAFQKLGTTAKVNDYVLQLMGAVGSIYRRDLDVELKISSLYIWSTADTFSANKGADGVLDTGDQLNAYQAYLTANRSGVDRDIAHLVNYNTSLGGIAYVDTLCRKDYAIGVSNVYAALTFPGDVNTYYWDTMVVAHEIGHNFGSPHTHCFSPPIDCCYIQAGCSECSTAAPAAGTIMSYCHLQMGKGGSIIMKFHDRCIQLMRNRVEAAGCITPFSASARVGVTAATGTVIAAGDTTPSFADDTDFGSVDLGAARLTRTFTLANMGSQNLVISGGVTITGSRQIAVTAQPTASTLAPGAKTTFAISFDPTIEGQHDATVAIASNDPQAPKFQFAVRGSAVRRAPAQTFIYAGGVSIPDGSQQGVTVAIPVSGISGSVMDIDFIIEGSQCSDSRYVGVEHPYVGDLRLVLESPSGTRVTLMDRPGGGTFGAAGRNFCGTTLDDESGGPSIQTITSSGSGQLAPPYSGKFKPHQPLATFYGQPANGTWKIQALDLQSPDPGVLRAVSIRITGAQPIGSAAVGDWMAY